MEEKRNSDVKELLSFIIRWILLFLLIEISSLSAWFIVACYIYLALEIGVIKAEDEEESY